jgi:four helix bundle protein
LKIIAFCEVLKEHTKFEMSTQLFKSGTSIGANSREAQNAESKADFTHKFKIALKESDETDFWLCLCKEAPSYPNPPIGLIEENLENNRIMSKIVSSSKK